MDRSRKKFLFVTRASDAEMNLLRALAKGRDAGMSQEWIQGVIRQLEEVVTITKVGGMGGASIRRFDLALWAPFPCP